MTEQLHADDIPEVVLTAKEIKKAAEAAAEKAAATRGKLLVFGFALLILANITHVSPEEAKRREIEKKLMSDAQETLTTEQLAELKRRESQLI